VIVVDDDIDPFDAMQVDWAMATRFQADRDTIIIPRIACSTLDPSCPEARVTAGLGIDATAPMKDRWRFEKVEIPGVDKVKYI
jgi:UbiD family decarboxylase